MRISFFEEFPSKKNLERLQYVSWPTTVYVAARSLKEFHRLIKPYKKKNIIFGYWPVLRREEGYWLSPFSSTRALIKIIDEFSKAKERPMIMWDAELPLRHPWLFLRVDNFLRNKPLIKTFFRHHGKLIRTSEYPLKNRFMEWFFSKIGVSFSPKWYGNCKIIMYYTSMHHGLREHLLENIKALQEAYGENLQVGLGTIATGILGSEPILSPRDLERDLEDMKKIGISEVVIFRLGGMDDKYAKVLRKYAK